MTVRATSPLLGRISRSLIGEGEVLDGPDGPHRVTYTDYTASGRALDFVEDYVREHVLPLRQHPHRKLRHGTAQRPHSTTCSASRPAAAARVPVPTGIGCSPSIPIARTPTTKKAPAAARASNPAGRNFDYFISDSVAGYLVDAVTLLAEHGHRLLPDYRFDPHTGLWRHARANEFPADVSDLRHFTGAPPGSARRLGEDAIAEHLQRARHILDAKPDVGLDGAGGLSEDFEALHWFRLPPECLA